MVMPINGVIGIICETKVKIDLQHVSQSRPTPEERKKYMGERSPFRVATLEELMAKGTC